MLAIWSLVPLPFLKPAWTSGSSMENNAAMNPEVRVSFWMTVFVFFHWFLLRADAGGEKTIRISQLSYIILFQGVNSTGSPTAHQSGLTVFIIILFYLKLGWKHPGNSYWIAYYSGCFRLEFETSPAGCGCNSYPCGHTVLWEVLKGTSHLTISMCRNMLTCITEITFLNWLTSYTALSGQLGGPKRRRGHVPRPPIANNLNLETYEQKWNLSRLSKSYLLSHSLKSHKPLYK